MIDRLKLQARNYYYGLRVPQNYSVALALYLRAANMGDPEAQYIAGGMYFKGMGADADYAKAFELLYLAAKNGKSTPESQRILGESFLLGRTVPKSYPDAIDWYKRASEAGDRDAQNELGFMYFVGRGTDQDYQKAYDFFRKAAFNGLPMAQYNVGIMMYTGNGVPTVDLPGAYAWFNLAASNGHQQSWFAQQFLESILSSQELEKAQAQSKLLYELIDLSPGQ